MPAFVFLPKNATALSALVYSPSTALVEHLASMMSSPMSSSFAAGGVIYPIYTVLFNRPLPHPASESSRMMPLGGSEMRQRSSNS